MLKTRSKHMDTFVIVAITCIENYSIYKLNILAIILAYLVNYFH